MTLDDIKDSLRIEKYSKSAIPTAQTIPTSNLPFDQKRYRLGECLGAGGSGQVFKARDTKLLRDVAIKIIPIKEKNTLCEAQALARFNHPSVVKIHDVAHNDEYVAIVMEYVKTDKTLNTSSIANMEPQAFYDFFHQVITAVNAIHEQGLLHLDLKPGNILLDQQNQVKVTDFGISVSTCNSSVKLSNSKGSWYCLSPEQIEYQKASKGSDVFALGVLWYVFLYKEHPFLIPGNAAVSKRNLLNGKIKQHINTPNISTAGDEQLVLRMLAKNPRRRPSLHTIIQQVQNIQHIQKQLTQVSGEEQTLTQTLDFQPLQFRRIWQWPAIIALIITLTTLFIFLKSLSSPIKATLVIPTLKIDHKDNSKAIKHQDNNLLVATIIEDELEAAVIRDPQRRLVSKKEWQGTRNWLQESQQLDVEDILISEVSCDENFCDIRLGIFNRTLKQKTHVSNKRIPHVDLMVLSQALELLLNTDLELTSKKK